MEEITEGGDRVKGDDEYPPHELAEFSHEEDAFDFFDAIDNAVCTIQRSLS